MTKRRITVRRNLREPTPTEQPQEPPQAPQTAGEEPTPSPPSTTTESEFDIGDGWLYAIVYIGGLTAAVAVVRTLWG